MVSAKQVHVPERPNDLVGTLANTCVAKSLLGFQTRKAFRAEMKKHVDEILAKQASDEAGSESGSGEGGDGGEDAGATNEAIEAPSSEESETGTSSSSSSEEEEEA